MGFRVFKTTYKDRQGKTRKASKWYVEFRDHFEKARRLPAFESKAASEEMGRNLVKLVAFFKSSGGQVDPALTRWLTDLPQSGKVKLAEIGLLTKERVAIAKLLMEHVDDWKKALESKGSTSEHVNVLIMRVRRVIEGCGFKHHGDIKASVVQSFLHDLRQDRPKKKGISAQTFNFYLANFKQFCRWLVKDRRAAENPVGHLDGLNVKTDRRHDRRAFTDLELGKLLEAAHNGPDSFGMTGPERSLLYRLAVETGLRANELRSLTRASFDLDSDSPNVTVEAGNSKHRQADTLPIRQSMVETLRPFLAMLAPTASLFHLPAKWDVIHMFRADLDAANIEYRDDAGLVVDFHALRHTFVTNLARGGVHPKVAQSLARHSTITLTMDKYSHTLLEDQAQALEVLPNVSHAISTPLQATGTEGKTLGTAGGNCLGVLLGASGAISVDSDGSTRTKAGNQKSAPRSGNSQEFPENEGNAPVAQLDRAMVFETIGYRFDPCRE